MVSPEFWDPVLDQMSGNAVTLMPDVEIIGIP